MVKFTLAEALSQPFRLEVDLASLSASVDFDALLDTPVTFTIYRDGVPVRVVHGILTGLEQGSTGFRRTRYRAIVEPALVRLSLRQNSRIFQRQAVPDILKTLLTEQRVVERQFDLVGAHLSREYCVQHRESDARFFDRLAAEEGLVYYFEPGETTRLRLTDALATGPTLGGGAEPAEVPYQPAPGGDAAEPRLWHLAYRQQLAPTRAVQRDYTFKNPPYDLQQQAQAREGIGEYEHYESPGRYKQDQAGKP
ncbi:MAG TPA: type VI secretion system tip protein TssI/VgrG, partial [Pseudoxanthomonas sp.]|nr:type VI secretion system tip protein TssI/VgrG [Pseudoxanthomonas sp.]